MEIMKYIKKSIPVEAVQWFKMGDHPEVKDYSNYNQNCLVCGQLIDAHGWIGTLEGGHIVCPSDWIIKDESGYSVLKDSIFKETYEKSWIPEHHKTENTQFDHYNQTTTAPSQENIIVGDIPPSLKDQAKIDKDFIKQYQKEVKGLRKVLEFYACKENYDFTDSDRKDINGLPLKSSVFPKITVDMGKIARKALGDKDE